MTPPNHPIALAVLALASAMAASSAGAAVASTATDEPAHLVVTARGDTLIGLGRRLLVDPSRWPELARANGLRNPDRIATGATLRIPWHLMHTATAPATVLGVAGQVSGHAAVPVQAGQALDEGGALHTGADGHATLRLVDGTVLRLRPASRLQLIESQRVRDAGAVRTGARLEQGRVEVEATPAPAGRPGFRIETPQGVLGVRGTEFRVTVDPAQGLTRGEVLTGVVAVQGRPAGAPTARPGPAGAVATTGVTAGFGTVIGADGQVLPPVRLLAAPDLAALPALHEQLLLRFALPPLEGAVAYRGQIGRDASFDQVLADTQVPGPELRFAGLDDGDYLLRVRGVDGRGIEGRDAEHRFRLKARPEAPLPSAPAPRAVLFGGAAEFAWTAHAQASSYRLRVAADGGFATVLHDVREQRALTARIEGLAPGRYHWQLASVRADGDQGPWSAARSFDMRPSPPQPSPPQIGAQSIALTWEGLPGQTFDFELARDADFTQPVLVQRLERPAIELPKPGVGRFYLRLRARDADGFVGPYTTPQHFDLPNCLRDQGGACVRAGQDTLNLAP